MSSLASLSSLEELTLDNRFTRELPADPETRNVRRQVYGACYSRVRPTPVRAPRLLAYSPEVARLLDLDFDPFATPDFAEVFGGNRLLDGMDPFAMCYGGHQFGSWAGQLGDGRAINLGEVLNSRGEHWTLQLKGAGPTPYSRTADGLAVLRSSVREFLCSEAMHHLGVPTTRALSLVGTGEQVLRDMFYDGNPRTEPGAVVCRVAPSFVRFGNFEIFAARRDHITLRQLIEFTIRNDYPHLGPISPESMAAWFEEVCSRTLDMIVHWMRVGFVHGVMNTDNMSILGLTIDYGPYGWLEDYDPDWTPNTTDAAGRRYRFGQQPQIALWNLWQLANAIAPALGVTEPLEASLKAYAERYDRRWREMMTAKLGLSQFQAESDEDLLEDLVAILQSVETDMTLFFRQLARVPFDGAQATGVAGSTAAPLDSWVEPLASAYYQPEQMAGGVREALENWLRRYHARVAGEGLSDAERQQRMDRVNPRYVLRNYLAQLAIDRAEQGDASLIQELLDVLRQPYAEQPGKERFAEKRPEWARHRAGCSMLSCSS
jgi:serine/tyrosine/threonine adenylyltransferase